MFGRSERAKREREKSARKRGTRLTAERHAQPADQLPWSTARGRMESAQCGPFARFGCNGKRHEEGIHRLTLGVHRNDLVPVDDCTAANAVAAGFRRRGQRSGRIAMRFIGLARAVPAASVAARGGRRRMLRVNRHGRTADERTRLNRDRDQRDENLRSHPDAPWTCLDRITVRNCGPEGSKLVEGQQAELRERMRGRPSG